MNFIRKHIFRRHFIKRIESSETRTMATDNEGPKYFIAVFFVCGWLCLSNSFIFDYRKPGVISFESINDKTLFPDLPPGPLDRYRKNAKFDWRKLALTLDDERCLRFRVRNEKKFLKNSLNETSFTFFTMPNNFLRELLTVFPFQQFHTIKISTISHFFHFNQNSVWSYLEDNHLFARSHEEQTIDQYRELTVRRINKVIEKEFVSLADVSIAQSKAKIHTIRISFKKLTLLVHSGSRDNIYVLDGSDCLRSELYDKGQSEYKNGSRCSANDGNRTIAPVCRGCWKWDDYWLFRFDWSVTWLKCVGNANDSHLWR